MRFFLCCSCKKLFSVIYFCFGIRLAALNTVDAYRCEERRTGRDSVKPRIRSSNKKRIQLKFSRGLTGSSEKSTADYESLAVNSRVPRGKKENEMEEAARLLIPETRATFWTRFQEPLMLFSGEWLMIFAFGWMGEAKNKRKTFLCCASLPWSRDVEREKMFSKSWTLLVCKHFTLSDFCGKLAMKNY